MITKFALEYVLKTHWIMALQNFLWIIETNFSLIPLD